MPRAFLLTATWRRPRILAAVAAWRIFAIAAPKILASSPAARSPRPFIAAPAAQRALRRIRSAQRILTFQPLHLFARWSCLLTAAVAAAALRSPNFLTAANASGSARLRIQLLLHRLHLPRLFMALHPASLRHSFPFRHLPTVPSFNLQAAAARIPETVPTAK